MKCQVHWVVGEIFLFHLALFLGPFVRDMSLSTATTCLLLSRTLTDIAEGIPSLGQGGCQGCELSV